MKTTIQIKSIFGKVLFEYEKENNTIKQTVLEAIRSSANLRFADLSSTNLRFADLSSANLSSANLRFADLSSANLSSANLRFADLSSTNLRFADLSSANLSSAEKLNKAIRLPMYCKWDYGISGDKIHIGCESRTIKEWDKFFKSNDIIETKRDSDDFKRIEAVYKGLKAYYNHLNLKP